MVTCDFLLTYNLIFAKLFARIIKLRAQFQNINYVDNAGWFSRNCMPPILAKSLIIRTNLPKEIWYEMCHLKYSSIYMHQANKVPLSLLVQGQKPNNFHLKISVRDI